MTENVLLLTIDSLRWDAVHSQTPRPERSSIDQLVRDGVAFERAFATGPGTQPSFPALLTGTHLLTYGGLGELSDERPRVASNLRDSGLSTGGFHSNPFLSEQFDYDAGFETFRDYQNPLMGVATRLFPRGIEVNNPRLQRIDDVLGLTDRLKQAYQLVSGKARPYVGADVITDDTLEWLDSTTEPFFCWAHYMDVHHPCYPPTEYRERHDVADVSVADVSDWYAALINDPDSLDADAMDALLALYNAAIDFVDDQIERLVDHLRKSGRYDETMVIVTSDHGEMFGEHGEHGKPPHMYDELLHVPLIVANGPESLTDTTDELVSLIDVPPLVHDALGLDVSGTYEGRRPGATDSRSYVLGENELDGNPIVGARSSEALYEYDASQETERVYEIRDGTAVPEEDLAPDPALKRVVMERLEQWEGSDDYDLRTDIDGGAEERLRELGYL